MKQLTVIIFAVLFIAGCASGHSPMMGHTAHSKNQKSVMAHVSPMPNLMPLVVGNADALGLTEEQTTALAEGRSERFAKVEALASAIMNDEKMVRQAALDGKPREEINSMSESIMEQRLSLIDIKADCRDVVRKSLNDDQWSDLLALYMK